MLYAVLIELDDTFDAMYATSGRSSVPPEPLLKATVLMAMHSIRSERAFCERLKYVPTARPGDSWATSILEPLRTASHQPTRR